MNTLLCSLEAFGTDPRAAARAAMSEKRTGFALAGYLVGAAGLYIWLSMNGDRTGPWLLCFYILLVFALEVVAGLVSAAAGHMFLELSGKTGSAKAFFCALGISGYAAALYIPLRLIVRAAPALDGIAPLLFLCVVGLRLGCATALARTAYACTGKRAAVAVLLPFILLIAGFMLLAGLATALAIGGFISIFA